MGLLVKRYRELFCAACIFLSFLANAGNAPKDKAVIILADDSYPPYSFMENGQIQGIYVDLVLAAAKSLTPYYQVQVVAVPWKRGLRELNQGSALALIPPYKHIEKRPYIWPYSIALLSETVIAYCHRDIDISSYINSSGVKPQRPLNVGINAGYQILNRELTLAKDKGNIVIRENKDTRANILKLLHRRLDCYLNDRLSTLWELKRLRREYPEKDYQFNGISEALLVMTQTAHIGYTDSKEHKFTYKDEFVKRMDEALALLHTSGEYERILAKYVEGY